MSFARISTNRFAAVLPVLRTRCTCLSGISLRTFASNSEATGKLLNILEKYRQEHYQQTIPSRFVKDILKYTDTNKDGLWSKSEFEEFLDNIGARGEFTEQEVRDIMSHVGGGVESEEVSIPKVQEVLLAEMTAKKK